MLLIHAASFVSLLTNETKRLKIETNVQEDTRAPSVNVNEARFKLIVANEIRLWNFKQNYAHRGSKFTDNCVAMIDDQYFLDNKQFALNLRNVTFRLERISVFVGQV